MTRFRGQIHSLETAAALLVNDVDTLHQPGEITQVVVSAGATASVEIIAKCRATHSREGNPVASYPQRMRRISRPQCELRGSQRNFFFDETAVELHQHRIFVDFGSRICQQLTRLGMQKSHAVALEKIQRGVMDGFELIRAQDLNGRIRIHDLTPGQLADTSVCPALAHSSGSSYHA